MSTDNIIKELLGNMGEKTAALLETERANRIFDMALAIQVSMPLLIEGNKQPGLSYEQSIQEIGAAYAIVLAQHAAIHTPVDKTKIDTLIDLTVRMSQGIQAGGKLQGVPEAMLFAASEARRREAEARADRGGARTA